MRRTAIKWLHWLSLGFLLYFLAIEPEDVDRLGAAALATHAGVGMVFAVIVLSWFGMYLVKGLAGRPGPKLQGWAREAHIWSHRALYWSLVVILLSGGLIGLFAPYVIQGFGIIPILPNISAKSFHDLMQESHELLFNLLIGGVMLHAIFHLWRHTALRDNALRIMMPKTLHRYL